ncbi:N-alpha-acetyltransferase 30 [Trichosurus vulpecula]|uniref:N-alpha-acetyltransferase 30 n=1 Tax=Trichosurus vulpecula TaxID=9337 RepID=UPI00186B040A|nr:N-alpha-acetyltransferase 30 [Trichosurus vulpecula]
MAEIPPGPSSLLPPPPPPPAAAEPRCPFPAGAAPVCCSEDEEDDEEHRGGGGGGGGRARGRGRSPAGEAAASKGHQRVHCPQTPPSSLPPPAQQQLQEQQQQQQLNGLISPELRHLRAAASLKSKIVGAADTTDGNPRAAATKRAGQPPGERPPHTLPNNARTAPPNPAAPAAAAAAAASGLAAARNGLAGGTEQEEEEEEEEEDESLLLLSSSLTAVCSLTTSSGREAEPEEDRTIRYVRYESELQMPDIMRLITKDLSEPYSIYTYRYFIHNWPQLCFLAVVGEECVGAIVCKLDMHKKMFRRGYIAMLAVDSKYRRNGIGTNLVKKAIYAMVEGDCDEVVLETEITNKSALKLYENLGFVRDKRLFRYYLNGVDALRLKLWLR